MSSLSYVVVVVVDICVRLFVVETPFDMDPRGVGCWRLIEVVLERQARANEIALEPPPTPRDRRRRGYNLLRLSRSNSFFFADGRKSLATKSCGVKNQTFRVVLWIATTRFPPPFPEKICLWLSDLQQERRGSSWMLCWYHTRCCSHHGAVIVHLRWLKTNQGFCNYSCIGRLL